ncbi:MAG: hypothetical protein ABSG25_11845 [Bryobacteraceae bacterium]
MIKFINNDKVFRTVVNELDNIVSKLKELEIRDYTSNELNYITKGLGEYITKIHRSFHIHW